MRELQKWVWTVVAAAAVTGTAAAQTSSTFSGSSGSSGAVNTGTTSGGGTSSGGGSGNGLGGSSSGSGSNPALQTMQSAPSLTAPTGTASSSLSSSNSFSGYYANPYFQGLISATTNATPGGFGMALYGTSTGTTGTGSVNRGTGGVNNNQNTQISGVMVPIPVQINYSAQVVFATAPIAASQMQSDLRSVIDSSIANPKGVQVITDANNNVILRGQVKDAEEVRLVEGLVRITPGVRAITNQLTAPAATTR